MIGSSSSPRNSQIGQLNEVTNIIYCLLCEQEHSFLSDFNIHEELFGNNQQVMTSQHQYYGPTQSVAPPSVNREAYQRKSLPGAASRESQEAKLVGTKRRKIAQVATTSSVAMSGTASECNDYPQTSPFEIRVEDEEDQHFQINIESLLKNSENLHKPPYDHQYHASQHNTSTYSSHHRPLQYPSAPHSTTTTRRFTDYVTSSSNYYDDEHEEDDASFRQ